MRASSPHRARTPAPRRRPALLGLLALTVIDWTRAPAWVAHVSSAGGLAATAAAMALSGGATSPARFLLLFALVYPSCFYPPWEAPPYLVAVVARRAGADDLARRDPLTGLANGGALMEAVGRHAGGRRAVDRLGLLLLDVD